MSDNRILPENFWTEHQYNVGKGDGKEIKCYGHHITDRKIMDNLLRESLKVIENTEIGNADGFANQIILESASPQSSDLTEKNLSSISKDAMGAVKNIVTTIDIAKNKAVQRNEEMVRSNKIMPKVKTPSMNAQPMIAQESIAATTQNHLDNAVAAAGAAAASATDALNSTVNDVQKVAERGIAAAKATSNQVLSNVQTGAAGVLSKFLQSISPTTPRQNGGRKTRRRKRRRKRNTKHKRKKKRSTRKRKKRTKRRRK
jgi:hypothetical protein